MDSINELIIIFDIALLAIVATIFVLAVTLLGRAVKIKIDEEQKTEQANIQLNLEEIEKIEHELKKEKSKGKRIDTKKLEKYLANLKRKNQIYGLKLIWIRVKYNFLTVTWGVFLPGALLFTSIIFSSLELHHQSSKSTTAFEFIPSIYTWIAIITTLATICLICLTLKIIEGISLVSEDITYRRQKDIFVTSLREYDEGKELKIELLFLDEQPPFHIPVNSTKKFRFALRIINGVELTNPTVYFFAPPGFDFPEHHTFIQPVSSSMPNYISIKIGTTDVHKGFKSTNFLNLKASSETGNYSILYQITGTGFSSEKSGFQVIVDEG